MPQSQKHVSHVSPLSGVQAPSPHLQDPQSSGQSAQASPVSQAPSPQVGQSPQSSGQLMQFSPPSGSQVPFPQLGQSPQSSGQE